MSIVRAFWAVCFVAALASSAGCGAGATFVVQHYDGPPRSPRTIAIVRVRGDQSARLVALDGADSNAAIERDVRLHIEVLPGAHVLHVANAAQPEQPVQRLSFTAEPGRVYQVFFVQLAPAGAATPVARVYEVGADSDTPLRDVTLVKREPAVDAQGTRPAASP